MKHMLFLITFTFLLHTAPALAQEGGSEEETPRYSDRIPFQEQSIVTANLFKTACIANFGVLKEAEKFLNKNLKKVTNSQRRRFVLNFTKTSADSQVWVANFRQGINYVVTSPSGACHVMAENAHPAIIHNEVKALSDEMKNGMVGTIKYEEAQENGNLLNSEFKIYGENKQIAGRIVASTPIQRQPNDPSALLSMYNYHSQ